MIIGSDYIYCENLSSTNTYSTELLRNKTIREGTIIQTGNQTAGRGHGKNTWESEAGKNLLISIILYPSMISPSDQFIISKFISLGIFDFVTRYSPDVSIKWPNDIYVGNDKIAGILIEAAITGNEINHIIAGIGLNINQKIFGTGASNPVSLTNITGIEYDTDLCLKELALMLDNRYKQLLRNERSTIDKDYSKNLYRLREWSRFSDSKGEYEGRIVSVSQSGCLRIEDHHGRIQEYGFKEVGFL